MDSSQELFEKILPRLNKIPYSHLDGLMVSPSTSYEYMTHPDTGEELRISIQFSRPTIDSPRLGANKMNSDIMIHVGPNIDTFMENPINVCRIEYVVTFHTNGDFEFRCYEFNIKEKWFRDWLKYNIDRIFSKLVNHTIGVHEIGESKKISNKIKNFFKFLD